MSFICISVSFHVLHVVTVFFSPCICFPCTVSVVEPKMVRAALVTATSLALTGAVVAHAYFLKHQFYPTVVYLTKSSPSMAVRPVLKSGVWLKVCEYFTCVNVFKYDISSEAWKLISFFVSVLLLLSGVVHSGLCAGVSTGKVHEEGLFWTAKGCRDGGRVLFNLLLTLHILFIIYAHWMHLMLCCKWHKSDCV